MPDVNRHPRRPLVPARRRKRTAALALGAVLLTAGAATLAQSAFNDLAATKVAVVAHTVPTAVPVSATTSGTGESIKSRLKVTCATPGQMSWRWRDHMVEWGTYWNTWSAWSAETSATGWTGWSTSTLEYVGRPAEVQWEVRCGISTWTSTAVLSNTTEIIRSA